MAREPEGTTPDAGEPVEILREFREDVRAEFVAGVRRKIHRTATVAQLADYSWSMPGKILLELIQMLRQLLGAAGQAKGPGS